MTWMYPLIIPFVVANVWGIVVEGEIRAAERVTGECTGVGPVPSRVRDTVGALAGATT
jgi:hypothetical protein